MKIYFLTGNPSKSEAKGGMRVRRYEERCRDLALHGYTEDSWTFWDADSQPGDQVVLLRTGPNGGIIGFGLRCEGTSEAGFNSRKEYPVRFYNLRSTLNSPFISREVHKRKYAFWPYNNAQRGGLPLDDRLLSALDNCCRAEHGVSFSTLCNRRI